jgi:hypothetical protein
MPNRAHEPFPGRARPRPSWLGLARISGPGHVNALGALFAAQAAESPMVLLSDHAALYTSACRRICSMKHVAPATQSGIHETTRTGLPAIVKPVKPPASVAGVGASQIGLPIASDMLRHSPSVFSVHQIGSASGILFRQLKL